MTMPPSTKRADVGLLRQVFGIGVAFGQSARDSVHTREERERLGAKRLAVGRALLPL
jgi:hypothetical protein